MSAIDELTRRVSKTPCAEALRWLKDGGYPTLQAAWDVCPRGDWMEWLVAQSGVVLSAPALRAYDEATAPALRAYYEAKATAWRAYEEAEATAWRAYREAEATALRAYEEAKATAWRAMLPTLPPETPAREKEAA